jgi:hypothetical protein
MKKYLFSIICIALFAGISFADIPKTLNYQGRLMNTVGQPVIDGQYTVKFRLYTAAEGGTMAWEEVQTVASNNGYFNAVLGNITTLSASIFDQALWIGMQVGSEAEMTPRQKLGTAAYAISAEYALTVADEAVTSNKIKNSAIVTEKVATDAITTSKIKNNAVTDYWEYKNNNLPTKENTNTTDWTDIVNFSINPSGCPLLVNTNFSYFRGEEGSSLFRIKIGENIYGPFEEGFKVCCSETDRHRAGGFTCIVENVTAGTHTVYFQWKHQGSLGSHMNYADPIFVSVVELKR